MLFRTLVIFTFLSFLACNKASDTAAKYPRWIGDIVQNPKIDKADFSLCRAENEARQYFNLGDDLEIEGDKYGLIKTFKSQYDYSQVKAQSGLIRIRFIVNCRGESDRFRLISSDLNYQEMEFDSQITDQLMSITKSLTGWKQKVNNAGQSVDYYQYLIFRLVDGKIVKILP